MDEVVGTLGKSFEWEWPKRTTKPWKELDAIDSQIGKKLGCKWLEIHNLAGSNGQGCKRRALILLYAHLLRLPVSMPSLHEGSSFQPVDYVKLTHFTLLEQTQLLLQMPQLLGALLTVTTSRSWLIPTLSVMQLHAYLAQALLPGDERFRFAQLPGIQCDEVKALGGDAAILEDFVAALDAKSDRRTGDVKKAVQSWGRLELVDVSFKGSSMVLFPKI